MFDITEKQTFIQNIHLIKIKAHGIANLASPGQFIIFRINNNGERIPLSIFDVDKTDGTVSVLFQEIGVSTKKLARLEVNDSIMNFVGPLGKPFPIKNYGTIIIVAGGLGLAGIFYSLKSLKDAGNKIIVIYGAKNKKNIIFEKEIEKIINELVITTDDGSYKKKGYVTNALKEVIEKEKIDLVFAVGPLIMMKAVSEITKFHKIKTLVDLNPIMIDGIGMCGCCRVIVGGETKLTCVDGTAFDGHLVDFEKIVNKSRIYSKYEDEAIIQFENQCSIHGNKRKI